MFTNQNNILFAHFFSPIPKSIIIKVFACTILFYSEENIYDSIDYTDTWGDFL